MASFAQSFVLILSGLRATLAGIASADRSRGDFVIFLWNRISSISGRLERLFARWKNGTLPRLRAPRPPREREARPAPPFRLPGRRKWLVHASQLAIGPRSQLCHLIATDPEIAAFLRDAPQARRLLNPICHMLGIDLDAPHGAPIGLPPPPPRRPRVPRPPAPKRPECAQPAPQPRVPRPKKIRDATNYSPGPCRLFSSA